MEKNDVAVNDDADMRKGMTIVFVGIFVFFSTLMLLANYIA
jgi:hypothetical protein